MFRFTIRDVLWLTVVVGLSLRWLAEHRTTKQRLGECYSELRGSEVDKELMERFLLDFPHDNSKIEYAKEMARDWRNFRRGENQSAPREDRSNVWRKGNARLTFQHADFPDEIDVTTSSLDAPELVPPRDHTRTSTRLRWIAADGLPEYAVAREQE